MTVDTHTSSSDVHVTPDDLIVQNENGEVFDMGKFELYMSPRNIRDHMMPIIRSIILSGNRIYMRFLQIFNIDFSNIFFYDYNLNREELAEWFSNNPPIGGYFTVPDYLRMRDFNVSLVFARDAVGNRILKEDGSYAMGIMDEYPELFYVLSNYLNITVRDQLESCLFNYLPLNM
jgi:hypothetical protein